MVLEAIVVAIAIAVAINLFLSRWDIPAIIGYILTGIIVSYGFGFSHVSDDKTLNLIAEFGIVFLMFTIGLEFSVKHMLRLKHEVFMFGPAQVFLTMAAIFIPAYFLIGLSAQSALIVSSAMALSSTAVVLKILNANGDISKEYGRRALGILIFQDLMVIPILLMISIFSDPNVSLSVQLLKIVGGALFLFTLLWMVGRFALEPFLSEVVRQRSDELFIGSILFVVLASALLAHSVGFTYSLGAFLAGMVIAETRYKYQVEADLIPFRDILLGIFFVTVGMQLDLSVIFRHIGTVLALVVLVGAIKAMLLYGILRFVTSKTVALKTAMSLFQTGEFALVIFELASQRSLLDGFYAQLLSAAVIVSMILTPFVMKHLYLFTSRIKKAKNISLGIEKPNTLFDHIAVIGYGRLGKTVCEKLERLNASYIAIDNDIHTVEQAQAQGKPVYFANAAKRSVLESLGFSDAAAVIVALDNSEKVHRICAALEMLKIEAPVIVKVDRFKDKEALQKEFSRFRIVVGVEEVATGMVNEAVFFNRIEKPLA